MNKRIWINVIAIIILLADIIQACIKGLNLFSPMMILVYILLILNVYIVYISEE